ncbi:PREDICTED: glutathione S-transferase T3-like [Camelina sativa]|uniref:Glutathione S-transferase T3-like n=1 Tax=Camelina sativa TaxID=90675 RepID=A0ABM0T0C2_CAMSA|nr:PREDICTED: glutathione S-transferase T3-like [Camelina sativa]
MDSNDSMNPYHPSSSYMNLLHSQLDNQNLEYTHLDSPISEIPSEPPSPQENRKSRKAWLPTDDIMLREASQCKQRWGRISDLVCKFVGCYEAATREKSSGQNEDDVILLAHQIYFNDHGQKFTLEHAWLHLRYDKKWCASISKGNGVKRGRVNIDGSEQDAHQPIDVDESLPRPPGVKAAKEKSKKSSNTQPIDVEEDGKAYLEFQLERVSRMYEMKQKDFELKEREFAMKKEYIKHVMLDNLTAKKDSLTESEKALKDKLIDDMMSS